VVNVPIYIQPYVTELVRENNDLREQLAEVTADRDRWVARMRKLERRIDDATELLRGRQTDRI
jgi:hypothetical protein